MDTDFDWDAARPLIRLTTFLGDKAKVFPNTERLISPPLVGLIEISEADFLSLFSVFINSILPRRATPAHVLNICRHIVIPIFEI
jgi:hypothetical protein